MRQGLAESGPQSTVLPVEIGFLAHHGHAPEALHQAAILAQWTGVPPDEFLLKYGLIDEDTFYRALAAELRLPFQAAPRLSPATQYPGSILAGLAPLARPEQGFVLAPRGASLAHLLKSRPQARPFAITGPTRLAKAVFQAKAPLIAHSAAFDLPKHAPDLSARDGIGLLQLTGLSGAVMLLSFGGFLAAGLTLGVLGAAMSLLFLGIIVLRLAASLLKNPVEPVAELPRIEDAALPVYTVIVALYREKRIAARLINALTRIDYPSAKLDIKLVLEADDLETLEALGSIDMPGNIEVIIAPKGQPRTKPRALDVALPLARGRYTVIYDAEDVPDPGQLRLAAARFAQLPPGVACLQARLTIDNTDDSWLTRFFTIEYAALFDVVNPGLAEIGSPIPLGGTSNHFRTSMLRDIRGWDAWNVTEDADLGLRLARLGHDVMDLPSSTLEEAPSTLRAWMQQRTRWMKGFVQTSISHSRKPWTTFSQLGIWRFYAAMVLSMGSVLSALAYPVLTGMVLIAWWTGGSWASGSRWEVVGYACSLTLFVSGAASIFVPACVALHRRRLWRLLPWVPLLPFYYVLVSLAAWRALWELAVAPFRWNKTSHGLARTSRTGLFRSTTPGSSAPGR